MEKFIITGASQSKRKSQKEIYETYTNLNISEIYDSAILMEIDFSNKSIDRKKILKREEFDHQIQGYATNFTAPFREDNRLYIPSHAAIFVVTLDDFKIVQKISLKCFNDLHHVRKVRNKLWAVSTGIDSLVSYDLTDQSFEVFSTLENEITNDFNIDVDYRSINTKPHKTHPNYINIIDGERWMTRAVQHDFFCLDTLECIKLSDVVVHDGFLGENYLYFTAVNGQIITVDFSTKKIVNKIDLKIGGKALPAWCRGIFVDSQYYYVGFSIIRTTKISENINWIKAKLKNEIPFPKAMILKISKTNNEVVDKFEFDSSELTAIFSIIKI